MVIDNFDLIGNYLQDYKHRLFYDCSIIRRGKDHPGLPSANHTIKSYFVDSPEYLESRRDEVINLCNYFGARAYINLAPKSYEKLAKLTAWRLNERIFTEDFQKIYKCFNSCSGELRGEQDAWIVDIDNPSQLESIKSWINIWFSMWNDGRDPIHCKLKRIHLEVPTLNGYHLVTDSFNLQDFKREFPMVDVHKNNPTLLYFNDISCKQKQESI